MDFSALHSGAAALAVTIAAAFNLTFAPSNPPPADPSLEYPERIESYNLTEVVVEPSVSAQNFAVATVTDEKDIKLAMITKEPEEEELVTVEEPPEVSTVEKPSPKPSAVPSVKAAASPSAKPSEKPEPTKEPEPKTAEPVTTPSTPNADLLFQMVNDHRAKIGKAAFEKDEKLCKIAEERAPQVKGELASGTLHKGFKDLKLPYWATENIAAYQTIKENFNFLINDYIHRVAIESDNKYSCVACSGTSCSQIFTSFVAK